jgi:carbonic anhydrase
MELHQRLLLNNKIWAQEKLDWDGTYFDRLASAQKPDFLWIGCSDSRVPTDEVTDSVPGEIFVHRNIANLVVENDLNMLSVLQYAVEVLKVRHVIVCGHYGCGGVMAAMGNASLGLIDQWLVNIKQVRDRHQDELDGLDEKLRFDRMVELNTKAQVENLTRTDIIRQAWQRGQFPVLHGWVFDLKSGLLKEVVQLRSHDTDDDYFRDTDADEVSARAS